MADTKSCHGHVEKTTIWDMAAAIMDAKDEPMPREIFPASYGCDCGQVSHHFENTIRSLKEMSWKKRQSLVGDDGEHEIIFHHGAFVAMWCPKEAREISARLGD